MLNEVLRESKSRLSRIYRGFLSGKKLICLILVGWIASINAQGITNTLGGNTADDKFVIENKSSEVGLVVTGEGNVGIGITNPSNKLHIIHNGDNPGLAVNQSGEGNSSVFTIDNTGNSAAALEASSNGTGHVIQARHFGLEGNAGRFRIDNAGNSNVALYARTDGNGPALGGNNMGNGIAGFFNIIDSNNDKTALEVKTNGIGSAGIFEIDNSSNTEAALVAVTNGTGPALHKSGCYENRAIDCTW